MLQWSQDAGCGWEGAILPAQRCAHQLRSSLNSILEVGFVVVSSYRPGPILWGLGGCSEATYGSVLRSPRLRWHPDLHLSEHMFYSELCLWPRSNECLPPTLPLPRPLQPGALWKARGVVESFALKILRVLPSDPPTQD